jgi:hypothetical protein
VHACSSVTKDYSSGIYIYIYIYIPARPDPGTARPNGRHLHHTPRHTGTHTGTHTHARTHAHARMMGGPNLRLLVPPGALHDEAVDVRPLILYIYIYIYIICGR